MPKQRAPLGKGLDLLIQGATVPAPHTHIRNSKGYIDATGERWGSKAEYNFYQDALAREARGEICNLRRKVHVDLMVNGIKVGYYTPDAMYEELVADLADFPGFQYWMPRLVEVKGYPNAAWPFRKKVIEAALGIALTMIPAKDWSDTACRKRAQTQTQEALVL